MDSVNKYLLEVLGLSSTVAEKNYKDFAKYDDIKNEFVYCIENGSLPNEPIVVEGYSAKDIQNMAPFMNYLGIYKFLISLRENPDETKRIIKEGFKIK
ncbi:MAG: hypothetical protein IJ050_07305 [Clostridia bacterium]|nr:hypothetical protein [Clostridia bacterium]